jgi:hypothetical protein
MGYASAGPFSPQDFWLAMHWSESESDNDACLHALDAMDRDEPQPQASAAAQERARFARTVMQAVRRRELASEPQVDAVDTISFGLYKDAASVTLPTAVAIAFHKHPQQSLVQEAAVSGLRRELAHRVRATVLHRYKYHVARALETCLETHAHVVSFRFKWDETEQVVGVISDVGKQVMADVQESMGARAQHGLKQTALKRQVMTVNTWIKTPAMSSPQPWICTPRQIARTTGECIWSMLKTSSPYGVWGTLPSVDIAQWIWLIYCCDEASSNKRIIAQALMFVRTLRPRVLQLMSPCMIHIMHRSIIPVMRIGGSIDHLFRCAHVLMVGSYWEALTRMAHRTIEDVVILHHTGDHFEHRRIAEDILHLTLGEGNSSDLVPPRVQALCRDLLDAFVGDWTSSSIKYRCRTLHCPGGEPCKKAARTHLAMLMMRALFGRRVVVPSANRWWMCLPLCRNSASSKVRVPTALYSPSIPPPAPT